MKNYFSEMTTLKKISYHIFKSLKKKKDVLYGLLPTSSPKKIPKQAGQIIQDNLAKEPTMLAVAIPGNHTEVLFKFT